MGRASRVLIGNFIGFYDRKAMVFGEIAIQTIPPRLQDRISARQPDMEKGVSRDFSERRRI
jgi:hypothetical protein